MAQGEFQDLVIRAAPTALVRRLRDVLRERDMNILDWFLIVAAKTADEKGMTSNSHWMPIPDMPLK